jgi:hypothetical protein
VSPISSAKRVARRPLTKTPVLRVFFGRCSGAGVNSVPLLVAWLSDLRDLHPRRDGLVAAKPAWDARLAKSHSLHEHLLFQPGASEAPSNMPNFHNNLKTCREDGFPIKRIRAQSAAGP